MHRSIHADISAGRDIQLWNGQKTQTGSNVEIFYDDDGGGVDDGDDDDD